MEFEFHEGVPLDALFFSVAHAAEGQRALNGN